MRTDRLVTVTDLAQRTGVHRTSVLRAMKKRGARLYRMRDASTGFQTASAVSAAEAARFESERRNGAVVDEETVESPAMKSPAGARRSERRKAREVVSEALGVPKIVRMREWLECKDDSFVSPNSVLNGTAPYDQLTPASKREVQRVLRIIERARTP